MRVRPKNVSCRKLIGLASRWTQSSSIEDGRHGGGTDCGVADGDDAAVANAWVLTAGGRCRKSLALNSEALWRPASMLGRNFGVFFFAQVLSSRLLS